MSRPLLAPRSSLAWSLSVLGLTAIIAAGVQAVLLVELAGEPTWVLLLFPLLAVVYISLGLLAWWRRPANRIGLLLVFGGWALFVAGLANVPLAVAVPGTVVATLILAIVVHLLHVFPSGQIRGTASRAIVAAGYLVTLVIYAPQYLFRPGAEPPFSAINIRGDQALYDAALLAGKVCISLVMALTAIVLWQRVGAAPRRQRPGLAFVYLYGVIAVLALTFAANVFPTLFGFGPVDTAVTQLAILGGVPVVIGVAMLRGELSHVGGVEVLVAVLEPDASAPKALESALGDALGDPTARLLPQGAAALADASRGIVEVRHGDHVAAAIEYDALLFPDADAVRPAAGLVGLVLERDRLAEELRRHDEELRRSRDIVATTAEEERRRIARDLHDGVQAKLTMLALHARLGEADGATLATEIEAAIDELRGLIAGVMPPALIERGLTAALEDLTDRSP
ncbi:MAG: hypothetical protein JHD16_14380, partial [Solirubrobacteraceae bacterium]|nr:hypothetical protein [Solirubrobacteraceae bacterium]